MRRIDIILREERYPVFIPVVKEGGKLVPVVDCELNVPVELYLRWKLACEKFDEIQEEMRSCIKEKYGEVFA